MPTNDSNRILMAVWLLVCFILATGFSGNMKANMMQQPQMLRLRSMEDVVAQQSLQVMALKGSAITDYLERLQSPIGKKFWAQIKRTKGEVGYRVLESVESLEKVLRGEAVLMTEEVSISHTVVRRCPQLQATGAIFYTAFYPVVYDFAIGYRRELDPDFVRQLEERVSWIKEAGLLEKWMEELQFQFRQCVGSLAISSRDTDHDSLGLHDLLGVFVLWFVFVGAGMAALLGEFGMEYLAQRH